MVLEDVRIAGKSSYCLAGPGAQRQKHFRFQRRSEFQHRNVSITLSGTSARWQLQTQQIHQTAQRGVCEHALGQGVYWFASHFLTLPFISTKRRAMEYSKGPAHPTFLPRVSSGSSRVSQNRRGWSIFYVRPKTERASEIGGHTFLISFEGLQAHIR